MDDISPNRIFISYASEDYATARRLYDDLKHRGFAPWLDRVDLLPGQRREFEINRVIRSCSRFIAMLSKNSLSKRGHVQKELKKALDVLAEYPQDSIFLLPVKIEECAPQDESLRQLHWIELFPSYSEGLEAILRSLNAGAGHDTEPSGDQRRRIRGNALENISENIDNGSKSQAADSRKASQAMAIRTMPELTIEQRKLLKDVIKRHPLVRSDNVKDREHFLDECGLGALRDEFDCKAEAFFFASRVVGELARPESKDSLLPVFLSNFFGHYAETMSPQELARLGYSETEPKEIEMEPKTNAQPPGTPPPTTATPTAGPSSGDPPEGAFKNENFVRSFIREAVETVPEVRWAVAVGAVAAVVGLVSMPVFGLPRKVAFFGVVAMVGLMGILVIFARMSHFTKELIVPAKMFSWFILFLFMLVSALLVSSGFFGWPREFSLIFG